MQFYFPSPPPALTVLTYMGQPFTLMDVFDSAHEDPAKRVPRLRWLANCAYPGCGVLYTQATGLRRMAASGFYMTCEEHRKYRRGKYGWHLRRRPAAAPAGEASQSDG